MAYHSALKDELEIDSKLDHYTNNGNEVFAWDITQGIHDSFWRADAIYSEPSWRDGYTRFMQRAGKQNGEFKEYLCAIADAIGQLQMPTYVLIGKHMLKALHPPTVIGVRIHGYGALAGIWNAESPTSIIDAEDLCQFVCMKYETVLDFCCGYGNVAKYARRFVCSDVNRKCVYYVARTFMGYDE
jgi:hypothetical protein